MSALKEFANFISLNVANLAATYDRLRAENSESYAVLPADKRMARARQLIKTVAEVCQSGTPDLLYHLFDDRASLLSNQPGKNQSSSLLAEVECLGQTLTPVVTNLEAGKFLWQMLSEARRLLWQKLPESTLPSWPKPELTPTSLSLDNKTRFLSYIIENSQVAQVALDEQARIQYINPFFCSLYGYQTEEVLGRHVSILSGEAEPEAHYSNLLEIAAGQDVWRGEDWRKRKDGSIFPASVTFSGIRDENGSLIAYLDVSRDVSERRNTQEQLRQLSQVVEQSPTIVIITNTTGQIEYVNPKFCQITGYSPAEVIGQNPKILKSGETPAEEYKRLWQSISSGQEWHGELHNKKKNGELYRVSAHISPIKDAAGRITHYLSIQEDITAYKQAEEKLEQLRHQNLLILQSVGEGIISVDAQGRQTFVNSAAAKMLGYEVDELIGLPSHITWHYAKPDGTPYPQEECPTHIALTQGIIHPPADDEVFWRKDGTSFPVEYLSTPIVEEDKIVGSVITFRDVTTRKQLKEQTQQSLIRLTRQIEAITEVAQQIAGTPNLDDLFQQVVNLMQSRFGYYHAQIYTLIEGDMVLQAGTGEVGYRLKERGHKIPLSAEQSLVVRAVWEGEAVLAPDVLQEPTWLINPLLPETKAELAVPITLGAEVLGVLDVQSDELGGLNEEDRLLLIGLCGQISIAIETRRVEAERVRLLAEVERRAQREQTIRTITERMRTANNLEQLVKITARELGQQLSAGHAIVELGLEKKPAIAPSGYARDN
ncbi:MAG: hypothetical protein Fur0044_03400 [Anaerolineae bacterium]